MSDASEQGAADELFAQFLAEREVRADCRFEDFVAQHEHVAGELRELHALWLQFEGLNSDLAVRARAVNSSDEHEAPQHDRYRVEGVVGSGGMGVVFRVRDAVLDRVVAMKVVRTAARGADPKSPTLSRSLARFFDEARITSRLAHPGVVPIHELGRDEQGRAFFTMRLVEGETLAELLSGSGQAGAADDLGKLLDVLRRACETVAYSHSRGVIHRDLKPANIMVGRFGEVYVMDWGLARDRTEESERTERGQKLAAMLFEPDTRVAPGEPLATLDGDVVGTPAYMPPEQARGELAELDATADVYALGAMLYHLCAGRAPFAGIQGPHAKLAALREGPPRKLGHVREDLSPELVAICERAMQREPRRRYPDVGALGDDLSAFLQGRVVLAFESGPWAQFRKWVGRNRRLAGVALFAGLASLAAVAGVFATLFVRDVERSVSQRFQDLERLDDWEDLVAGLWPALPSELPRMDDFVADAQALVDRYGSRELRQETSERDPGQVELVEQWSRGKQRALLLAVRELADPDQGAIAQVRARIATARAIAQLESSPAIRSAREALEARGTLAPSVASRPGWLPRGVDPVSGFEVFEHLPSASLARLESGVDAMLATALEPPFADCGVLLVALPRQSVDPTIGIQPGTELPPDVLVEREVAPFFVAKYELTTSQAARLGHAASRSRAGLDPVRGLSAHDADRLCIAAALDLPTGDQWLSAAAGGVRSAVWWGAADDLTRWNEFEVIAPDPVRPEPVGSRTPNPFGLYDMLGNVEEWGAEGPATRGSPNDPSRRRAYGPSFTWRIDQVPTLWSYRASGFSYGLDDRRVETGLRFFAN